MAFGIKLIRANTGSSHKEDYYCLCISEETPKGVKAAWIIV